jgi:hypothetical protein
MTNPGTIKEIIRELNSEAIFIKGFDDAIIGTGKVVGGKTVAVYSADKCLEILNTEHDMEETESWNHFHGIVSNGKPNINKPIFISDWRQASDIEDVLNEIKMEKEDILEDIISQIENMHDDYEDYEDFKDYEDEEDIT